MNQLPNDIVHEICKKLNIHSICSLGMVNHELYILLKDIYPESRKLLNSRIDTSGKKGISNHIFAYEDSLQTYEQKENWAKIANNTKNRNMYFFLIIN